MEVKKVLIPTDFSENSNIAITAANIFIDLFGCKVDLIHVVPLSSYLGESISNLGIPIDINNDVYPKILENANEELLQFSRKHFKDGTVGKLFLPVDRKPANAILKQAKEGDYDMIIMSAKGEHSSEFFHGSVTEKVVRHSEIPVLTLDNHIHHDKFKTIVVPTDLSGFSLQVIPAAFELAEKFNAKIQLLYVMEPHTTGMELSPVDAVVPPENPASIVSEEDVYKELKARLELFFESYERRNLSLKNGSVMRSLELISTTGSVSKSIPVSLTMQKGITAHHEIIDYANSNADLVVMATHGKTGLKRMLLGSTTEQVIQHLEMPVLTIKPGEDQLN